MSRMTSRVGAWIRKYEGDKTGLLGVIFVLLCYDDHSRISLPHRHPCLRDLSRNCVRVRIRDDRHPYAQN